MSKDQIFNYGIDHLTAQKALAICRGEISGILNDASREKIRQSSEIVAGIAEANQAVYGINTGFGPLCTSMISAGDTRKLQENILKSHAVGVGEPIDGEISRLMLILKLQALAQGYSGIREETLDRMLWLLNIGATPVVPKQGSVGASGDLAPLSHLFLPLIGLGKVVYKEKIIPTDELLRAHNLMPIELGPKEGLALINGTQFIAAHAVKVVEKLHRLLTTADLISAMMIEGLMGSEKPFHPKLHQLRPYPGSILVAENISGLLKNSEIIQSHANCEKVQDPYSLRCIPQVHGASRTAWMHLNEVLEIELNAVTDNPVIFSADLTISGGNFHGQPLAMPLDYACLAASELGSISDRRIYLSLEGNTIGVPKLLMCETGLNSGFMIVQYTSAALASENKGLCFPASADSIPTSLGQEDHVSMGSISGRKALQVIGNVEKILGIELFCAAQAMDFHQPLKSGAVITAVHKYIRTKIPHLEQDQIMYEIMETAIEMVQDGSLLEVAQKAAATSKFNLINMNVDFKQQILAGIPAALPPKKYRDATASHTPVRRKLLTAEEEKLSIRNALRYFPADWHEELGQEFLEELQNYGRIYMYRFMPDYAMYARPIADYPFKSLHAAGIMLMIQNNLDPAVAQHPQELITYGGNGSVFQNWAQYLLTMQYLATMTDTQTLNMYSGHPQGLFPSNAAAPRVVISNGMMIPNYSSPNDLEKYNALGVTQYGQMTAGSYMYIGPQGIVHGTTITLMNAFRKKGFHKPEAIAGQIFLTAGLGGMSGAQPKAGNITGCITVCAEVNPQAAQKRFEQGWVDELLWDLDELVNRVKIARDQKETVSLAYIGNVVSVWERFDQDNIKVAIGSDQTSLHNPFSGGYYPVALTFEEANTMMADHPVQFKVLVQESLRRHAASISKHTEKGTYFFDYGNAFLLECSRADAAVLAPNGLDFKYPSYVEDILGPMCFDFGFGPFRWVCASGTAEDLEITDQLARNVLEEIKRDAPAEIQQQLQDNINWISAARSNKLVVGSKARILYADAEGRAKIALKFNDAIRDGRLSAPVILGRDHHDVSGTDSPFRETSNIYDGSKFTADMAIQNVIGDSFRGATWVSIHNGGGVGWGEVINGGFGLLLDGTEETAIKLKNMLFFDVNNGIARRSWARNPEARFAIEREMARTPDLKVTLPNLVSDELIDQLMNKR